MTLADLLASLFPAGHDVTVTDDLIAGNGPLGGGSIHVLGIAGEKDLGVDDVILLAGRVLQIVRAGDGVPILVLIDSSSQRMRRRDELLGLNEYLAHWLNRCYSLKLKGIGRSAYSMAAAPRAPSSRRRLPPPAHWWRFPAGTQR